MSSYTKSTDFASKDALLTGNPLKVVKGTEIDDEFNAIQTAVNSKADTNSAALTGTPTAPTAATTTDTTQIATTAFVQQEITANATTTATIIDAVYPVGSIFISTVSTNPNTLLGRGTWTAFATGRTLVGIDSGDTDFDTVEETGGAKTHTLTEAELPAHSHNVPLFNTSAPSNGSGNLTGNNDTPTSYPVETDDTGSGDAHNNMPPYIVTYMWKRTA
jgi:hypothetical protein